MLNWSSLRALSSSRFDRECGKAIGIWGKDFTVTHLDSVFWRLCVPGLDTRLRGATNKRLLELGIA